MSDNIKLSIRKALPSDIDDIQRVTQAAFTEYRLIVGAGMPAALTETKEDILRDMEKKTILIGHVNAMLAVGTIRYELREDGTVYISRFAVSPNWQQGGMGHLLIDEVERFSRSVGAKAMVLHTATKASKLVRFYYGKGFYICSTSDAPGYVRGEFIKEL